MEIFFFFFLMLSHHKCLIMVNKLYSYSTNCISPYNSSIYLLFLRLFLDVFTN